MLTTQLRTINEERWLPLPGFEGAYEVSDHGNVRSISRMTRFGSRYKWVEGRVLKPKRRKGKYSSFILCVCNVNTTHMIHRLVAKTFLSNPNNYPAVNHKDGNKENNHVNNLEWCTYSHNTLHALDTGLNSKSRKLTAVQVREIRSSNLSDGELAAMYNVRKGNIWNIKSYKSWKHVS